MEIDEEYYNVQDVNNTSKRLSSPGIGINHVIENAIIHVL